jgi:hypothetical protein
MSHNQMMSIIRLFPLVILAGTLLGQETDKPIVPSTGVQNLADSVLGVTVLRDQKWTPPTPAQRWAVYKLRSLTGPGVYVRTFSTALLDQHENVPQQWGQGWDSFGKRVGSHYATFQLIDATETGLSALSGYDPRYLQSRSTGVWNRIGHAMKFNFVTLNREGKQVLNWPKITAAYGGAMLSTTYTPGMKWSAEGVRLGNTQMVFGILTDLMKEFTPDVIRKLRRKKAPAAIIPQPATTP